MDDERPRHGHRARLSRPTSPYTPRMRVSRVAAFGAVAILAAGAAVVVFVVGRGRQKSATPLGPRHGSTSDSARRHVAKPEPAVDVWETYGFNARRTRFAPGISLSPPFRRIWTFHESGAVGIPSRSRARPSLYADVRRALLRARLRNGQGDLAVRIRAVRLGLSSRWRRRRLPDVPQSQASCDVDTTSLGGTLVAFDEDTAGFIGVGGSARRSRHRSCSTAAFTWVTGSDGSMRWVPKPAGRSGVE